MSYREYKAKQPKCRSRFHFRMSEAERAQLQAVMEFEQIPDASKTIRYLIAQEAERIERKAGEA